MKRHEKNIAIYNELIRREMAARTDTAVDPCEKQCLLTEITELKKRARAGGVPREDWENHELNWIAFCAQFRRNLVRALARDLIACESRNKPNALNENMRRMLDWWRFGGGREELLGELPIAERRALEASRHTER